MSKVTKTLFGGTDDSAQMEQLAQNQRNEANIQRAAGQSRQDLQGGYGDAGQALGQGYGQALQMMGQAIPQQMSTFQQGNMGAQQYLLGGMPMYEAALRGRPVNYGSQMPFQVQYDPSFSQQGLPGQVSQDGQSMGNKLANALGGFAAGYGGQGMGYMNAMNQARGAQMNQYQMPDQAYQDVGIDYGMGKRIA